MKPHVMSDRSQENRWVAALKSGSGTAFERLFESSRAPLHSVAKRVLRHHEDAEDAVQDAFLCAFRGLSGFDGEARVSTWMHRIGVNAALMRERSRRRRPERSFSAVSGVEDEVPHRSFVPGADPDDRTCGLRALERAETRELVRGCIALLSAAHRDVIRLRDLEGKDTAETARRLGISQNAAKIRLHRAHRALRSVMERELVAA